MEDKNTLDEDLENTEDIEETSSEESEEKLHSYDLILKDENAKIDDIFKPIIGQEHIIYVLKQMFESFINRKEFVSNNIELPHGFLMYTEEHIGKTFILEKIASNPFTNILFFTGSSDTIIEDLENTFEKAKDLGEAIILIDDIDSLTEYDKAIGCIKWHMKNFMNENMLLIATATKIDDIKDTLIGDPFFEYYFNLERLDKNVSEYIKMFVNYYKIKFDPSFNINYATDILLGDNASYTDVNLIFNSAFYLNGKNLLSNRMFEKAYSLYMNNENPISKDISLDEAIHELGHYMIAKEYNKVFYIGLSNSYNSSIITKRINDKNLYNQKKDIMFKLAGNLAVILLLGKKYTWGAFTDNSDALKTAQSIISYQGLYGAYDRVCDNDSFYHKDSEFKLRNLEKKEKRLIKKLERRTRFKIKCNWSRILDLALIAQKRVLISGSELLDIEKELDACKNKKEREEIIEKYINVI